MENLEKFDTIHLVLDEDEKKYQAIALLDSYVSAHRLLTCNLDDIHCIEIIKNTLQMCNIIKLSELAGIPYERVDWEGNRPHKTQYDEVSFVYAGIKFFELVEKENDNG